ncbi:hypothetical protein [Candidatus Poriferisodalis sp.]|uniref:hypothetical protein n=1 Tax=Candidatus Poriferisodalis sp. TaxID=3101277 RepID=UPI003B02A782
MTRHRPTRSRRADERGLITLEWVLIFGAIAAVAAGTSLAVQRVVDSSTDVPDDPLVRVIDADIAAANVAAEAQAAFGASYDDEEFADRCTAIGQAFSDVVNTTGWTTPDDNGTPSDESDDVPASCQVEPLRNLVSSSN